MRIFFKIVSGVLHPMLLPFFGTILLFQVGGFKVLPLDYKMFIEGIVLLNTAILPVFGIWLLKKNGQISDYDVSVRSERIFPYLIVIVCYISAIVMFIRYQIPLWVVKLYIGSILSVFVAFFINLKWKISAHTMAFGCLVAGVFLVCLNQGINPLLFLVTILLLAGLQASSRIWLGSHTFGQVTAGFSLGFISVCATYFFIP